MLESVPDFRRARIIVAGDVMLDRYWLGTAARISPEAPVPVVGIKQVEERPGGAANVALNIARLGGRVTLVGVVGEDAEAKVLERILQSAGIRCVFLKAAEARTICKLRVLAQHQQLVRLDFEEPLQFDEAAFARLLKQHLSRRDLIVFSDYAKGTLANIADYIALARKRELRVLVDPKSKDYHWYAHADLITPNVTEFRAVVGPWGNDKLLLTKARRLMKECCLKAILLTRGDSGMTLIQPQASCHQPAQAREVYDVTGAGDTVIAVMALSVAANKPLPEAMRLANLAAGIVVGKVGTSTVSILELADVIRSAGDPARGIVSESELSILVDACKTQRERVVMTNGCFDVLHAGHVRYLEQARALGDRLIVAVNSDASVKRLKGQTRPLNDLHSRMRMLAALSCVDWVVAFGEDTPARLYRRFLPDVVVKGGDYRVDQVAGGKSVRNAGGKVVILPHVEGYSTTRILEKARGAS